MLGGIHSCAFGVLRQQLLMPGMSEQVIFDHSLKEELCLHRGYTIPAVSLFRLVWLVPLFFCSLSPILKNKLAEQLQENERERRNSDGS